MSRKHKKIDIEKKGKMIQTLCVSKNMEDKSEFIFEQ